jgi:L-methionine (R)-S-oxide reductase
MFSESDLEHYLTGYWLTDFANFSAFVFHSLPELNWAGFYLDHGDRLRLGPFSGKPACMEIAYDRGVCGAAYTKRGPLIVPDALDFPGHIACDPASRSEMVLPLLLGDECVGVFDLDSPRAGRFGPSDLRLVEGWLNLLMRKNAEKFASGLPWLLPACQGCFRAAWRQFPGKNDLPA